MKKDNLDLYKLYYNQKRNFHNIDPDYNKRLRKHLGIIKMLKGVNLDYTIMLFGLKGYIHPDKRKLKVVE